ncbi:PAS domain S-box protein [Hymenobacter negativus]|uniref:histidine kinase n=1 Tax=Hymenobacter negativus TaxID=2795026 RepID=A0ABS3QCK4_9BACT|nr:PAS domain S-box protein [Hymenobacter negativus]MBO2008975.1 PAS domain S-box protein [Hymenobacter negativus]
MSPAAFYPDSDCATQLRAEQTRCRQAEAERDAALSRLAALEQQLATTTSHAQRQQKQLSALVQNLRVGLVLVDEEGQIQFVNQHFWELFGLPAVAGPDQGGPPVPYSAVYIDNAFLNPAAFTDQARALHAAGQTVLQQEFALADGRMLELDYLVLDTARAGRLICYRDVTERHRREAEIRTLSYIPEQNPNPILRLTATAEVVSANAAAAPLLQALAHNELGLKQQLVALVRAALQSPRQYQQALAVAGEHYLFTVVAVPGQNYATLYLTNITERYKAEQSLVSQQAFYESILEHVPTAVAVFNTEHRYLFVNPAVEHDPGIRAWMIGKTSDEAGARRQRPAALMARRAAIFAQALREQHEVEWEEVHMREGEPRNFLGCYQPIVAGDGRTLVICSGIDITERKQSEEKMVAQQEFYEAILNLLPVDVAVFDAGHRFLFVNPSSISDPILRQQIVGLTSQEYLAMRPGQHPNGIAEQRQQYFDLAVRTRSDVTWEEMRTDRQNRPQLIVRQLRPVYNADGTLRLVVGSGIDITARYTAEKLQQQVQGMLQVQQAFVRQILDALPNVLYMVDPDDSVSFSNQAFGTIMAHSQHWQAVGAPEAVQAEMRQMKELNSLVRSTLEAVIREMPFTLMTGETLYFQVHKRPLRRADGQLGILTIATDITDVKNARHELERREKQYHDLVYYSQALICTHDLQGIVLSVNPAIEKLLDTTAAQLVGRPLHDSLAPEHHAAMQAYLDAGRPMQSQSRVMTVRTRSGERRYLQYYTYQVSEEGHTPYVVASGYDVTDGYLAQKALQQAKCQAEENALAKEAFLARMSHEIRTPLNGVLGMAGLLQKTVLTATQQEYLNTMQHAGKHLLALINDVLDMAKITTQHLQLNHEAFDLALALQGAGHTVAALAAEKGLRLEIAPLSTTATRVVGDAYRLHQVLLNLLSNAIKFTEQGSVRLGAEVIDTTPERLLLRFWVQDTGIGIAPEAQLHVFDAFAQANHETSLRFGGTGLGLSISGQLVHQMGGTLRMCSELGRGTTFSFQLALPRAVEATALPPAPLMPSYDGLQNLRVLLAEDNLVNQCIAVAVLENWGVQVTAVGNGLDALAQLQEHSFDAALLDIRMPGLSGVEVTTAIRHYTDTGRATIPIIALTANAFEGDRAAYLAAGMDACLTKPYEEADLCQALLNLTAQ